MAEKTRSNDDKIELGFLDKEKTKIMDSVDDGKMVAVLSGMEIMYIFLYYGEYQCFIHKFDAEDGRRKSFKMTEKNRAVLNNLDSAADGLFEIGFKKGMDLMGVMVAAERGIISYLDMTGQLPAEDADFMQWKQPENQKEEEQ